MRGCNFVFDSVDLLYYHPQKNLKRTRLSYIYSPERLTNKKATINLKNNDDTCFQYALTVALSHKQIENHAERISNFKSFINQHDWKQKIFPPHKEDWKKFESNKKSIALNILFVPYNTKQIVRAYPPKNTIKNAKI